MVVLYWLLDKIYLVVVVLSIGDNNLMKLLVGEGYLAAQPIASYSRRSVAVGEPPAGLV